MKKGIIVGCALCLGALSSNAGNVDVKTFRYAGPYVVQKRAEKTARNISKNVTIKIPEHFIPSFKPSKSFVNDVKGNVKK